MDLLRVLSFIMIIVYHFLKDLSMRGLTEFPDPDLWMQVGNVHLCMIAVGLFFMLSGAGLVLQMESREKPDWKKYYLGRFKNVLIPFYIVWIVYAIVKCIWTGGACFAGIAPWRIIFSVAGIDEYLRMAGTPTFSLGIGEWFLGALIIMYAIFPAIYKFMKKNRFVTMAAMTVYYILLVIFYKSDIAWHMNFFVKIYEFALGMFLAMNIGKVKEWPWAILSLVLIFLPIPRAFNNTAACALLFLIGMMLEKCLRRSEVLCKALTFVGGYSFGIYLVHHAIIYAVDGRLAAGNVILGKKMMLLIFVGELAVMIVCAVIVKFLQKKIIRAMHL